ncbi:MAG: site-2 protease family protein [Planctomycetes bacterium]|nr:site-2 protease family protein [Planctomycetota bacterium]
MTPEQISRIALWNFPVGKVARIQVNVHWSLLLYALFLLYQFRHNAQLGLLAILILWSSIFLHELGHCFAARQQGGSADKVILWVLGGLAMCEVEQKPWPQFVVAIWGPLVNVGLLTVGIAVLSPTLGVGGWVLPWRPWPAGATGLGLEALVLLVRINMALTLFNLVPAFPLDGGRVFHAALWAKQGFAKAMKTTIVLSFICAALIAIYALTERQTVLFFVALFVVIGAFQQRRAMQMGLLGEGPSEPPWARSAQAYERAKAGRADDDDDEDDEKRPGAIARWRAERAAQKEATETARKAELSRRLDEVLARVSDVGMQGLSDDERSFLDQASAEMREKKEPGQT